MENNISAGTWIVMSLYIGQGHDSGQELGRCRLDLVHEQQVSWDKGSTTREVGDTILWGEEMKIANWEKDIIHQSTLLSVI
jgi:hypothetical protein